MYILLLSGSKDPPSSYTTTGAIQERLSRLPQHWTTYVKVPNSNQNSENLQDIAPNSLPAEYTNKTAQNGIEDFLLNENI